MDRQQIRGTLDQRSAAVLRQADGEVYSIRSFALEHLETLSAKEAELVRKHQDVLAEGVPEPLQKALRLGPAESGQESSIVFKLDGARSAYLPDLQLQLKGCRPVEDAEVCFPTVGLDVDTGTMQHSEIPFGVLEPGGVMREVLAYVFAKSIGRLAIREPVAVFRYRGPIERCCLVLRTASYPRTEAHLVYPEMDLDELLARAVVSRHAGASQEWLPGELDVSPFGRKPYVDAKVRELVSWQMHGGFRGILNSNIGNDVIVSEGEELEGVALLDFDSFEYAPLEGRNTDDLNRFLVRACLESVRAAMPIAAMTLDDSGDPSEPDIVVRVFEEFSSYWSTYVDHLIAGLLEDGWSREDVLAGIDRAKQTPAFAQLAADHVISVNALMESYAPKDSLYIKHG